ncbi:MAG: hypothetical protein ABEJ85_05620 [Haloarculaceae archaeon]
MPKRCARCGDFAGRGRELVLPGEWVSFLRSERDVSDPVGTLKMPLCTDCYGDVESRVEGETPEELLDSIDLGRLVDEG